MENDLKEGIHTFEGGTVITGKDAIEFAQLCARKGALKLEVLGMKRRGTSAYAICKQQYGFKGNKAQVLAQMEVLVEAVLRARAQMSEEEL